MLIIKAEFPDGMKQEFGKQQDLYMYMQEEGYTEAKGSIRIYFSSCS